jgi:hypothetical protein
LTEVQAWEALCTAFSKYSTRCGGEEMSKGEEMGRVEEEERWKRDKRREEGGGD